MISKLPLVCCLAALACSAAVPLDVPDFTAEAAEPSDESWSQWRGPKRDGHSTDTGLLKSWDGDGPKLLWKSDGVGQGFASISVANGRLFTTGNFDNGQCLVAADTESGDVVWRTPLTKTVPSHSYEGSRSTPTVVGNRVYAVVSSGAIACVDTANGEVLWKHNFQQKWNGRMMSGWGFSESPLVDGDVVVCTPGGNDAMMVALNRESGEEIWRSKAPKSSGNGGDGAAYSSIVISNAAGVKQYVQLVGRGVIGVRASDGELLWTYNGVANGTANVATPIVVDDYVFCSTGYGTGSALLKLSGDENGVQAEEQYFLRAGKLQNHHGGLIRVGNHIYGGHGHGKGVPICVEIGSGKVVWGGKRKTPAGGSAAVSFADGHMIFRYESGPIALIEATPEEYRLKGKFTPEVVNRPAWSHPAISGGRMYLRDQDTTMCYDVRGSEQ